MVVLAACEEKPLPPAPLPSEPVAAPLPATSAAEEPEPEAEPEEIAAQHILVAYRGAKRAPRDVQRTKAEAKARAEEVLKKARAKEQPFEQLALEYSDDDSKHNRASLGKFKKDKMVPEFSTPAFKLKVGEISEVVETPFGFHVIKRNQ